MLYRTNAQRRSTIVGRSVLIGFVASACWAAMPLVACQRGTVLSGSTESRNISMNSARQQYVEASTPKQVRMAQQSLVAELRMRYGGIDASVSGANVVPHEIAFSKLMRDWSPIFFSVRDIKSIVGAPTSESSQAIEYIFDNGLEASGWRFDVAGEMIMGVEYLPGD